MQKLNELLSDFGLELDKNLNIDLKLIEKQLIAHIKKKKLVHLCGINQTTTESLTHELLTMLFDKIKPQKRNFGKAMFVIVDDKIFHRKNQTEYYIGFVSPALNELIRFGFKELDGVWKPNIQLRSGRDLQRILDEEYNNTSDRAKAFEKKMSTKIRLKRKFACDVNTKPLSRILMENLQMYLVNVPKGEALKLLKEEISNELQLLIKETWCKIGVKM